MAASLALALVLALAFGADAQEGFKKEFGFMSSGTEHAMGVDLANNFYFMSSDDGAGNRTLMKRKVGSKEQVWSVTYNVSKDEEWRSDIQMYDAQGNVYEVAKEYSEANTIFFRKFDGKNGKQLFNKKLTPCPGYSPDFTTLEADNTATGVVGIAVSCLLRDKDETKTETIMYGFDLQGKELYQQKDIPGTIFARIRASGPVFILDTGAFGAKGQYEGVWVMAVDAKTGKYVREPAIFKAGLGQKPENAQEAAILSAVAKGLGESDISQFVLPTDQSGLEFIQDIHEQSGTSAIFVTGRAFDSDGPTFLIAFDKKNGNELGTVEAGQGMPLDMYVNGNRVAVLSWDFDPAIGDEITVWNYTLPSKPPKAGRAWRSRPLFPKNH